MTTTKSTTDVAVASVDRKSREESLERTTQAFSPDMTTEESVQYYTDRFSHTYDDAVVRGLKYIGPQIAANLVVEHLPVDADRKTFRILDVGCGTGLIGEILHADGFGNVDGLDASSGMLNEARHKEGGNLYNNLYERFLYADQPVPDIADEQYDMVISSGAFANNHVPPDALSEIVRMVKIGTGLIGLVYRPCSPSNEAERVYQEAFSQTQQSLIEGKILQLEYEKIHDNYTNDEHYRYGRAVLYRRLK